VAHIFRLTGFFFIAFSVFSARAAEGDPPSPISNTQPYSCGGYFLNSVAECLVAVPEYFYPISEGYPQGHGAYAELTGEVSYTHSWPSGVIRKHEYKLFRYPLSCTSKAPFICLPDYNSLPIEDYFPNGRFISNPVTCPSDCNISLGNTTSESGLKCIDNGLPKDPEPEPEPDKCEAGKQYTFSGNSHSNYPESQCIGGCLAKPSAGIPSIGVSDGNGGYTYTWLYTTNGEKCELPLPPADDKPPSSGGGSGGGSGDGPGGGVSDGPSPGVGCPPVCGGGGGGSGGSGGGNGSGNGKGNGDGDGDGKDGGKGSFGGTCGAFTCDGDAILCAMALKQHQSDCELRDTDNEAYQTYEAEKNREGSVTDDLEGNQTVDVAQHLNDGDEFIGSGTCPADRSYAFSYGTLVLPFSKLCPYLDMLGNALVAISSIIGAVIIMRR